MKNSYLVIISGTISIIIIYIVLFFYTFFNFNNEFEHAFKSFEDLNFHEKYSKKIHHIREKVLLEWLWKKPQIEDLLFTKIGTLDDKEEIVLFQGDSYMEQLTLRVDVKNNPSTKLLQEFKSEKKVGFVNGGVSSYSPSLMSLQLDVLENDFKILPTIVVAYIDQTDIGDENCRYKNNKTFDNGVLKSIQPETYLMYKDLYNHSPIYEISRISLNDNSKILKTFQLINFKFKYGLKKSTIRFYRKYISRSKLNKERLNKCYWNEIESYLIDPDSESLEYFSDSVKEYIKRVEQKKHIKKLFLVTFPHKKHFYNSYKSNVSDVVDNIVKYEKNITHINFSKVLLNNENFKHEGIWSTDNIHLDPNNHEKLFIQTILDEIKKYLL